jgi:peptidoglycan/xylan/chitin deacetylase (PgdA/CDA1 family)
MTYVASGAPWSERGGRLRGALDLLTGRYPPFVFGLGVGRLLPVFHFHETTAAHLEPALRYLATNGYGTVGCDDMAAIARGTAPVPPRKVLLAFDDALASVWLVAAPLLRRYGLTAVTYAIPGRVADAESVRPTLDDGPVDAESADRATNPFATWPELRALASGGVVEVQSHTWSHAMIFTADRPSGVVTPATAAEHVLSLPRINVADPPQFLPASRLGFPMFTRRTRMADARRFLPDLDAAAAVEDVVATRGGAAFFDDPRWPEILQPWLNAVGGRWETEADQERAIAHELTAARDTLEAKLHVRVRHVCLPRGVTGALTRAALERLGFDSAIANRMSGQFAVRPGDDPYFLKRLPNRHIFALPGHGRRPFLTFA